jgi:predicted extracellular nuclease
VAAIVGTDADVIGIVEIENDGYGPSSAIQFLVDRLNDATAPGTYAFIDVDAATSQVDALGSDAIKVGLVYRTANVTPVGDTAVLNTTSFINGGDGAPRNRASLSQAFEEIASGGRFIVNVNHLKSKGSACTAPDAGDGQGNCNIVRLNAANELMSWLASDPTGTGDPDVLIVGDLNSYAMEDPITAILGNGYTNLVLAYGGPSAYSYVFDGQWGYLDHALASPSLASQVAGVTEWHINSDEPSVLDYNTDFKSAGQIVDLYAPDQYRIADHDPVIVGLNLDVPVTFDFSGFFSPVENYPTVNNVKAGSSVPIKFSLNGDQGLDIFTVGYPRSQRVTCDTSADLNDVETALNPSASGLTYDPVSDQYNFVWKTIKSWAGTCRLFTIQLVDGTEHYLLFKFK